MFGKFLQKLAIATSVLLMATSAHATTPVWWNANPNISYGNTTIDVTDKGALGDGVHDDTAAIQAAIDALPLTGGTVYIPSGKYMIDALVSINMRSHVRMLMDSTTELHAITNGVTRYHIIKVWGVNNVEIVGGNVVGERDTHTGTTGEWGYGINISGSEDVEILNVHISNCWGDGLLIGGLGSGAILQRSNHVTLNNIVTDNNRRQGLTLAPSHHVYIYNSTFSHSNGTAPQAGIDMEPQTQGNVDTIRIENSHFISNTGNGIEIQANVSNLLVLNSEFRYNYGFGILSVTGGPYTYTTSIFNQNGWAGIGVNGNSHDVLVDGNQITQNSTRYISPTAGGHANNRDINVSTNATNITLTNDTLTP
jgi:hypothetical protein